jgi:large subunit ribosomal protein L18
MAMRTMSKWREQRRVRRHHRIRNRVRGTAERPRLVVHRSLKHMQGHLADDALGRVLLGVTTAAPELQAVRDDAEKKKRDLCHAAGKMLAERALEKGIRKVVFDRGGYLYHGRVAAFAAGAREGGLEF